MAYSDKVLDHYNNPRNVGSFEKTDKNVGVGLVGAPACGDVLQLCIRVDEDTGLITDARFKTYGCLTSNMTINTPTKSKKISDLKIGDEILAWNGERIVNQKIKSVLKHSVSIDELLIIEFQRETCRKNVNPKKFSVICTKEHVFWDASNKPVLAKDLLVGQELYEITEHELRILTNIRHRKELKEKNSLRMKEFNKTFDHSLLPQNQSGYVYKDLELKKKNASLASKKNWQDPNYIKKWQEGMTKKDSSMPTNLEQKFIKLFEDNNIGAKYSAGKIWIQTKDGPASPDFIIPGKKK